MRSFLLALLLTVLAACSGAEAPRSDYFVVFFSPSNAEMLPEGQRALASAAREAQRGRPRAVTIRGYLSSDGNGKALAEQRMESVEQGLVAAGVPQKLVQLAPETTDPITAERLGSGIVVQIERGKPPATPEG